MVRPHRGAITAGAFVGLIGAAAAVLLIGGSGSHPQTYPNCSGSPLTSQSQVQADTAYCGGTVHGAIVLANGDSWTDGDVSGAVTARQRGAVQCGNPCTLIDMQIHDNPRAFAGIYASQNNAVGPFVVTGGRVTGSGSLGIGTSNSGGVVVSGVRIDHNGATADCGFEGGGIKSTSSGARFAANIVTDNACFGIWLDIGASGDVIAHNTVAHNAGGGIFVEISGGDQVRYNTVTANGSGACAWMWGSGIGLANTDTTTVVGNTLSKNCNGVAMTNQNRPGHTLGHDSVTGNTITDSGRTGAATDDGFALAAAHLTWTGNTYTGTSTFCGVAC